MTEAERIEFEQLKRRHTRLEGELKLLGDQLALLENKFRTQSPETKTEPQPPRIVPISPPPIPPVIAPNVSTERTAGEASVPSSPARLSPVVEATGGMPAPLPVTGTMPAPPAAVGATPPPLPET